MSLTQNEIDQILDEMNKKCMVSDDGNEEAKIAEIPKTTFEKIAINLTIGIILMIILIALPYIFPSFFKGLIKSGCYTPYTIYLLWNLGFALFIISYLFMGIRKGIYFTFGIFFLIIFIELLLIVNYNELIDVRFDFSKFDESFTKIFTGIRLVFLLISIISLLIANIVGHSVEYGISSIVFNIFMVLYLFSFGVVMLSEGCNTP